MLSINIQNKIINLLVKQVMDTVVFKMKVAKYFSVIMDCTPDVSYKEQISLTIGYIH